MSDEQKQGNQKVQKIGAIEAAVEGVKAIAPGLNLKKFFGEVASEAKRLGVQGSAELAQALFSGGSYVPYGRGQASPKDHDNAKEQEGHGIHGKDTQEQSRDGRGR